jgi:phosphoesterase RecJ-like protein
VNETTPPATPRVPDKLLSFLDQYDTYYLVGHMEPDGDCIASVLALGGYLERTKSKRVKYFNVGPFERREILRFESQFKPRLPSTERLGDPNPAALILDCSELERVGEIAPDLEGLPTAVIDHHATNVPFGDVQFIDTTAAAACYLVQLILERMDEPISNEEADLLLFGIATDTGYFRHADEYAAGLFAAIARLLQIGASPKTAHQQMMGGHTPESRWLLSRFLDRTRYVCDGAAAITYETTEDYATFGKENRDSDTLYQLLFGVAGVRLVAFIREEKEGACTVSLRSMDTIDVSAIAKVFGGGGHRRAAGFSTEASLAEVRRRIQDEFEHAIRNEM